MKLIIDLGNTNTKFGLFEKKKLIKFFVIPTTDLRSKKISWSIPSLTKFKIDLAYIGSVVPSLNKIVINKLKQELTAPARLITPQMFEHEFDLSKLNMNEIGVDILGYACLLKRSFTKAVGFSYGTATFAVAIDNNKILGVAIAPSIDSGFIHLNKTTEMINVKHSNEKWVNASLGLNTIDAVNSGIFHVANGFLQSVFDYCHKQFKIDKVCLSGGKISNISLTTNKNKTAMIPHAVLLGYNELINSK